MKPVIEIVIVGNEILSGRTVDKNSHYMVESLADAGFSVRYISVVGDTVTDIADMLRISTGRADVVLVSGGLGPTSDDVTAEAAALAFGRKLILHEEVLEWLREFFNRRKRGMSDSNKKQAFLPEGAKPLKNPTGTAPCISIKVRKGNKLSGSGSEVYLMPGVPAEIIAVFNIYVLPHITASFEPSSVETATLNLAGISESQLYDNIKHLPGAGDAFSFYPGYTGIEMIIQTNAHSPMKASVLRDNVIEIMGDSVYSTCGENIEQVIAKMLIEEHLTIGIAESCTGGLVAHRLTNIPGSSAYLLCCVVAYSNDSKQDILGVESKLIETYGAVSEEVAVSMAEGVRKIAGSDIGISTTGIAGPGGGSKEKPVGLLYMSISSEQRIYTKKLQFYGDRLINKNRMTQGVLDNLRRYLKKLRLYNYSEIGKV